MKYSNQTYWQLRQISEDARKGSTDRCIFCGKVGTIGSELHVILRALATSMIESISLPAVCTDCEKKQTESAKVIG